MSYQRPTGLGAECIHGHLARQCPMCDLLEEIADKDAEIASLTDQVERLRGGIDLIGHERDRLAERLRRVSDCILDRSVSTAKSVADMIEIISDSRPSAAEGNDR